MRWTLAFVFFLGGCSGAVPTSPTADLASVADAVDPEIVCQNQLRAEHPSAEGWSIDLSGATIVGDLGQCPFQSFARNGVHQVAYACCGSTVIEIEVQT